MPHLLIEYSANVENQVDIAKLVERVHQAALRTGAFEVANVRTRAAKRDYFMVADSHRDNAFVAIFVRILPGRSAEIRHRLGQEVFDAACDYLETMYETTPLVISLEVQESDTTAAFRKNNLLAIIRKRAL